MSHLKQISTDAYHRILDRYLEQDQQFVLIMSVLLKKQKGWVYWNGEHENFFIIHDFGFCQLLELESSIQFDEDLSSFMLEDKEFLCPKLRWYAVSDKWLQRMDRNIVAVVERMQLKYSTEQKCQSETNNNHFLFESINHSNFDEIEAHLKLDLAARFWESKNSFLNDAFGIVAYKGKQPVSLCYSCGVANGIAEIDIFTDPAYRRTGLGKLVLSRFLQLSRVRKISPNWDCYLNNLPSVNLAKSVGFAPNFIYSHAIISR